MRCPLCGGKLKTTNTYNAGPTSATRKVVCGSCKKVGVVRMTLDRMEPHEGEGAFSLANRLKWKPK